MRQRSDHEISWTASRIMLVGVVVLSACSRDAYLGTPHTATWAFMQSVGGIRIEHPQKLDEFTWLLPVTCDVSGLNTVAQKPTIMQSGLVVTELLHKTSSRDIRISVVVNVPLGTARDSRCPSITLSEVSGGDYRVLYLEPNQATHDLGTVTFK